MDPQTSCLNALKSDKTFSRLNQIDKVRSLGIGDHISLPQLVVCGEQSAGKSSVLEGITGIPFPRQDGLCTRFATEIIMRHSTQVTSIRASILPGSNRSSAEKAHLKKFVRDLNSFEELPDVITEVGELMGLRGFSSLKTAPAFSLDALRLEYTGNVGLHLTVVDLPGLISVSENEQDVQVVSDLVDRYVESPRTVILAVVQATNDIETQGIMNKVRKFDKTGERTVGVITKSDLINKGTEPRVAALFRNEGDLKLKLGFFLLKNPSPQELRENITMDRRRAAEMAFFTSSPWNHQGLDMERVGIEKLRTFMQELLDRHVESEIPAVRFELRAFYDRTHAECQSLGAERSSLSQKKVFMNRIAVNFYNVAKAALHGTYDGEYLKFFSATENRLRAEVHRVNVEFAKEMQDRSKKRHLKSESNPTPSATSNDLNDDERSAFASVESSEPYTNAGGSEDTEEPSELEETADQQQLLLTQTQMKAWVKEVYRKTHGLELPGNYNYGLLSDLFHQQSSRWSYLATSHLEEVYDLVAMFTDVVLQHIITDVPVRARVGEYIHDGLEKRLAAARNELDKLLEDETLHPITYNHYFTDNVVKGREDRMSQRFTDLLARVDSDGFTNIMKNRPQINVDMEEQACDDALTELDAYYKVARKTFVDNVCRQVIERHILSALPTVFNSERIIEMSDDEIEHLAFESQQAIRRRKELKNLLLMLEACRRELSK